MSPVTPTNPALSTNIPQDTSNQEDADIWFDAIDYVEMEDTWFDPREDNQTKPLFSAGEAADSLVPFTEDCRRCIQQFVRTLGEHGESKMLSFCLSKILSGTPTSLAIAANSLYIAVTERRSIDTAALHILGLASGYLPENINAISWLATFIRDTVTNWTDETFLKQFLGNKENHTSTYLFTALAITAIVARRWMKNEEGPQRGVLKVPAFIANLFIRTSHYWAALGNMADNLPPSEKASENTATLQHTPAFEIDTSLEMTGDVCNGFIPCFPSPSRLTAFSSNSTVNPEAYSRGVVKNRPVIPEAVNPVSFREKVHYFAVDKLRQESGISELLYCTTGKTEFRQQTGGKVITSTYFNTKCDATATPGALEEETDSILMQTGIPKTQVSSPATGRNGGGALLPLVMTGATVAPVAKSYMQALKGKTFITAATSLGLTGLIGGIWLWKIRRLETKKINEEKFSLHNTTDHHKVDMVFSYEKNKTHESIKEAINRREIILDEPGSINKNDIKGNITDLDKSFRKYKKNKKYKSIDDYDYISCFFASRKIKFSEMKNLEEYPRLGNFSLNEVNVIVKDDIDGEIDSDVYKMALMDVLPEELIPFLEERKNNSDESRFYDTYHRYKKITSIYPYGMKKNIPLVLNHIRLASEELYTIHKSDESSFARREELMLELYHLKKLINNKVNIIFRPFLVRPVAINGNFYPPYEETFAARLLETVVYDLEDIPEKYSVTYGPAYQARKTLLAYSLYICGITSMESFNRSELNRKYSDGNRIMSDQDIYEYLINKAIIFISTTGNSILQEMSQHFICSVSVTSGLIPNVNIHININEGKEKTLKTLTLQEKKESFAYYLNQTIEKSPRKIKTKFGDLLYLSLLIEVISIISKPSINHWRGSKAINVILVEPTRSTEKENLNVKGDDNKIQKKRKEYYKEIYKDTGKSDIQKRKENAENKKEALKKLHKVDVIEESHGPLKLWTEKNNRAKILVLSSHGWYEKYDREISHSSIPKNKNVVFLGPNGEKLYEAEQEICKSATESLFIPDRYPEIYSRISSSGIETLNPQLRREEDNVINYKLKYYEKTPDVEYEVAVMDNRINSEIKHKVDFAAINELAGERKLSEILKYTRHGQPLENYDTIVFYACREYKCQGSMASGIGGGYTIKFTDIPLSEQQRTVRNIQEKVTSSDSIIFDGIFITDKYTIKIDRWSRGELPNFNYTVDMVGITPY